MSDDEPDAEPVFPGKGGPDREEMASDYLPEGEDWLAKTVLDVNDPSRIAALRNLGTMFPEIDDLQPLVDDALDDFLKGKTSVSGRSREEYRKILMGMYGASDDDGGKSGAVQLLAPEEDD